MARKARVEFAGAVYHVLDRGDRREAIFKDDADRRRFLETLGEVCARTGWRVHAFVLMGNHYQMGARSTVSREVGALEKELPKGQETNKTLPTKGCG